MKFANVIIDQDAKALDREFVYVIPDDLPVSLGERVVVPFGGRVLEGFVVDITDKTDYDISKIKSIIRTVDGFAVIKKEMLSLMHYMADNLHLKLASILRLFLPSEMRTGKVKELKVRYVKLKSEDVILPKNARKQAEVLEFLKNNKLAKFGDISAEFGYAPLSALVKKGDVEVFFEEKKRAVDYDKITLKKRELTPLQQRAVDTIKENKTYLLHGVTGSGKTEVYMNLIERELEKGKTALMLVPEISLTPQVLANFKARFGEEVALIHSGLSAGERFDEWRRIFFGEARVVVGARSAIFSPIENLGIIIIDEEHEQSYISESNPRYDTHEIAEFRRKYNDCILVLGSATPSIDSYLKALEGEYQLVEMPVRVNGMEMPKIVIIDMLNELRHGNSEIFSIPLIAELGNVVEKKKQAMIFINRRGFSSFQRCRECGYVAKCKDCDVSLVYHRYENKLKCHYCGKRYRALDICPSCGSHNIKQGAIGTERVVEELKKYFPDVPIFRMDNDTTSTKGAHRSILSQFREAKPGILVGTQMIAKGHDFEDVILVGIIDADQSLYQADYRSIERTFQLITQVSGRAGRSKEQGKVILQTYSPRHYVYRYAQNYDFKGFFKKEANLRKVTNFPPYAKVLRILFSHEDENIVAKEIKVCYNKVQEVKEKYKDDFIYLDVMKSPLNRIKTKYRYQILMRFKLAKAKEIEDEIFKCVDEKAKSSIFFEVNPQNLS
ncbi:MAG TPA: primosomal protein N' [Candidatus Caccovivens faecavium]|nr:primosomal protein N' [Candidatus Caccovivens faecavium]